MGLLCKGMRTWLFCSLGWLSAASAAGAAQNVQSHREIACSTCHDQVFQAASADGGSLAAPCLDCHAVSGSGFHEQVSSEDGDASRCLDCHRFHDPRKVLLKGGEWTTRPAGGAGAGHCRSCHAPGADLTSLSPGHLAAAQLYHRGSGIPEGLSPSAGCLFCHAGNGDPDWLAAAGDLCPPVNDHASHPVGVRVVAAREDGDHGLRSPIDSRLPLFDQRMHCQTCHQLSAGTRNLLIPFPDTYDLCLGCHRQPGETDAPLP